MEKEVENLIKKGESKNLEFKVSLSVKDEIGESVSAFSNTCKGIILIGVSDSGEIKGLQIGKRTIEELANFIKQNTDNPVYPDIKVEKINNKKIIVIEVSEADEKPVFFKGKAYKRIGKSTHKLSASEIRKMAKESAKSYWDEQVCGEASLEDIDEEKVRWFLKEGRKQRGLKISEDNNIDEALAQLKLLKNGKLTNAAVLLFCKEPKFLQSEIKCIRFKENEPVKPYIDFQTLEGSTLDLVGKAEDFVLRNIRKAIWLIPGRIQREEKYEYPPDAIREAIVNAVVHRDYLSQSKIQIRVFEDYIEIWNPGNLPEGWTVEKLKQKHESVPKNPLLFKQFFWVKFVEDVGGGTIDMANECRKWGIPGPEFEDTGTSLIVTFRKAVLTNELMEKLGLNERQKKTLKYLKEHKTITNKDYCELHYVVKDTANRDINDLLDKKLIEKRGSGPKTHYILVTTVRYRPISSYKTKTGKAAEEQLKNLVLNDRQKKAVEYVKKKGSITNREYKEINLISKRIAFGELSDLAEKEILIRKGKGRSVYYVFK